MRPAFNAQPIVGSQKRTIYVRDTFLWNIFVEHATEQKASVSSLIEDAMREYLEKHASRRVIK